MERWDQWQQMITDNPNTVLQEASILLEENELSSAELAEVYYWMALSCRYLTKMPQCLAYSYQALTLYEETQNASGRSRCHNLIGIVFFYSGIYEKAMTQFLLAKEIAEAHEQSATLCRIENNMGEVCRETGDVYHARQHYVQALEYAVQLGETYFQAIILENIGQLYDQELKFEKAEHYLTKSLQLLQSLSDPSALADVENKLGAVFYKQGQIELAESYFTQAFTRLQVGGNQLYLTEVLINMAMMVEDFECSYEELLQQAEITAKQMNAHHLLKKIHHNLSIFYEKKLDFESALHHYKQFHQIEQVIDASSVRTKLELLRVELNQSHNLQKMTQLNEQLTHEIDYQKKLLDQLKESNEQLNEEIYIDELTRVYNRKGLLHCVKSSKADDHLIVLIDIDHFKSYNDEHGHVEGDRALQQVAGVLQHLVAKVDNKGCVSRIGGEEFLLVLPLTSDGDADLYIQQIRATIAKLDLFYTLNDTKQRITVSGGGIITSYTLTEHFEEVYEQADQLLYRSKKSGRNQIQIQHLEA